MVKVHKNNKLIKNYEANLILENLGDAIVCVDNENRIFFWNNKAEQLYDLKAKQVMGQKLEYAYKYKWIDPVDEKAASNELEKKGKWDGENLHIKNNGEKIIVWSTVTVLKDISGKKIGLGAVIRDITEQKHLEEELERKIEELETLMDIAPVAIWISRDPGCQNIIGNKMANKIYEAATGENVSAGPTKGEAVQKRIFFKKGKELKSEELPMQVSAAKNKEILNSELEVVLPSGKKRTIWGNARPLRDKNGNVRGSIAAFMETTERRKDLDEIKRLNEELKKRAKELETSYKELQSFNLSLSHDISSPLRSISGYSQMILDKYSDNMNKNAKSYLEKIKASIENVAALIDDLKKLSKISIEKLNYEMVDLSSLALSIVKDILENNQDRDVEFDIESDMFVEGDRLLIKILLQNLLENAFKFTSGLPSTKIKFGTTSKNRAKTFFITDNGIGIDKDHLEEIFIPFRRLNEDKNIPGSGIGLSIAERVVLRHGGRIWVESKPDGGGTTFFFVLDD
jgi:PAS domain S-box-containing protein